jgi:hypothetical protein
MLWGYSAQSGVMRIQNIMPPSVQPGHFFEREEEVVADSGLESTSNIIPVFGKKANERESTGRRGWCVKPNPIF